MKKRTLQTASDRPLCSDVLTKPRKNSSNASQVFAYLRIIWGLIKFQPAFVPLPRYSDSVDVGETGDCISNRFPGSAEAAGLQTTLWDPLLWFLAAGEETGRGKGGMSRLGTRQCAKCFICTIFFNLFLLIPMRYELLLLSFCIWGNKFIAFQALDKLVCDRVGIWTHIVSSQGTGFCPIYSTLYTFYKSTSGPTRTLDHFSLNRHCFNFFFPNHPSRHISLPSGKP